MDRPYKNQAGNWVVPKSFSTPNLFADELAFWLSDGEWKVLTFAIRQILGYQDKCADLRARISLSTFVKGIPGRSRGTGLSLSGVVSALDGLIKFNVLLPIGAPNQDGQEYEIQFDEAGIDWAGLKERKNGRRSKGRERTGKALSRLAEKRAARPTVPQYAEGEENAGDPPSLPGPEDPDGPIVAQRPIVGQDTGVLSHNTPAYCGTITSKQLSNQSSNKKRKYTRRSDRPVDASSQPGGADQAPAAEAPSPSPAPGSAGPAAEAPAGEPAKRRRGRPAKPKPEDDPIYLAAYHAIKAGWLQYVDEREGGQIAIASIKWAAEGIHLASMARAVVEVIKAEPAAADRLSDRVYSVCKELHRLDWVKGHLGAALLARHFAAIDARLNHWKPKPHPAPGDAAEGIDETEPAIEPAPEAITFAADEAPIEIEGGARIAGPIPFDPFADMFWRLIVQQMENQTTKATFTAWITGTRGLAFMAPEAAWAIKRPIMLVGCPSAQAKDWLENRLAATFNRTAASIAGHEIEIHWIVADYRPRNYSPDERLYEAVMAALPGHLQPGAGAGCAAAAG